MDLNGKKILVIGDSITEGVGVSDPKYLYWKRLEADGCHVFGYGISGTTIARQMHLRINPYVDDNYFITRLPQMEPDADVIVILGGSNDYGHGDAALGTMEDRTDDTFYGALHHLFTACQKKYPHAAIIAMTPPHRLWENRVYNELNVRNMTTLEGYAKIIQEVVDFYQIPCLDLYHVCPIDPEDEDQRKRYMPDGVHPNDSGQELIYHLLRNLLKEL